MDPNVKDNDALMNLPPVVSPQEWDAAREELLVKEKALTRARDALAAERRRMPRMAVEEDYAFEGPDGTVSRTYFVDNRGDEAMGGTWSPQTPPYAWWNRHDEYDDAVRT